MQEFPVTSYPWRAFAALVSTITVLPLVIIGMMLAFFGAVPGWVTVLALAVAIGFLLSITVAFSALLVFVLTRNEITLRNGTLHLKGGGFHERVEVDAISDIRTVDLTATPALTPGKCENGVRLPGFRVGWFRLGDGSRAFVLLAGGRQAVYIQSRQGIAVLLGVRDSMALLATLSSARTHCA